MTQTNILWPTAIIIVLSIVVSVWRLLSMNKDIHQRQLAGLMGGTEDGIDAADIVNFIRLMGWDRIEATRRLAHAQSMVKPMFGPQAHKASLAVYRQALDQFVGTQRVEPQFVDTDDKSNSGDPQTSDDMIHVRGGDWRIVNGTLQRAFSYQGLAGGRSIHHLLLGIDKSEGLFRGSFDYHFHMILAPHPWPNEGDGFLVAHLGAQHDLVNHPFVQVRCGRCDDGSLLIGTVDQKGTDAMLNAVARCAPMRLLLANQEGILLELPIPNDDSFSRASEGYFR